MTQSSGTSRETDQTPSCKIDRVATAYDLPNEAERLGEYWTRDDDRYSLRELADHFNRQLLRTAMGRAGLNPLDGEVENTYRLLTDEDVSPGMRTQACNRLQKQDIDVDQLQSDFVSYGTVRRHLKHCLGIERESTGTDDDPAETGGQRIAALQNRTVAVTENTLSQLASAGELAAGDIDVFVDITVSCSVCGMHAPVREYIEDNGCDCTEQTIE
jgi:ABC-type phosphonate transport system ATPase subunit